MIKGLGHYAVTFAGMEAAFAFSRDCPGRKISGVAASLKFHSGLRKAVVR
ncbi:MAG: hypothetical protein ACOY15_07600 [Pseudomonadota bacterium]